MKWTVEDFRHAIAQRNGQCVELTEQVLARATDPAGVGSLVYRKLYFEDARASARSYETAALKGSLAGIPISLKDLFDVSGDVTAAGSIVLQDTAPATQDAEVVLRLRRAGATLIGRTNMTELAYSGVGINPHFGTPPNPQDRALRRIPGGSSSGAAVSVTDRMAIAALGSDTGGSIRIPAALCGLTGFKPTQQSIPRNGALPLSPTLDSVGVIAPTIRCCHAVDAVLRNQTSHRLQCRSLRNATFVVPTKYFQQDMDSVVANSFDRALMRLSDQGVALVYKDISEISRMQSINANGGFAAAESFRLYHQLDSSKIDPRVLARIQRGASISDADYNAMRSERDSILKVFANRQIFDGILSPTVPIVAPPIAALDDDEEFQRINLLLLRNTSFANFFNMCSVSLPCHAAGDLPVGLMITSRQGTDAQVLGFALSVEEVLADRNTS